MFRRPEADTADTPPEDLGKALVQFVFQVHMETLKTERTTPFHDILLGV